MIGPDRIKMDTAQRKKMLLAFDVSSNNVLKHVEPLKFAKCFQFVLGPLRRGLLGGMRDEPIQHLTSIRHTEDNIREMHITVIINLQVVVVASLCVCFFRSCVKRESKLPAADLGVGKACRGKAKIKCHNQGIPRVTNGVVGLHENRYAGIL